MADIRQKASSLVALLDSDFAVSDRSIRVETLVCEFDVYERQIESLQAELDKHKRELKERDVCTVEDCLDGIPCIHALAYEDVIKELEGGQS